MLGVAIMDLSLVSLALQRSRSGALLSTDLYTSLSTGLSTGRGPPHICSCGAALIGDCDGRTPRLDDEWARSPTPLDATALPVQKRLESTNMRLTETLISET